MWLSLCKAYMYRLLNELFYDSHHNWNRCFRSHCVFVFPPPCYFFLQPVLLSSSFLLASAFSILHSPSLNPHYTNSGSMSYHVRSTWCIPGPPCGVGVSKQESEPRNPACGAEEFLAFNESLGRPCFTHPWNTPGKRARLWCACNRPGREVAPLLLPLLLMGLWGLWGYGAYETLGFVRYW